MKFLLFPWADKIITFAYYSLKKQKPAKLYLFFYDTKELIENEFTPVYQQILFQIQIPIFIGDSVCHHFQHIWSLCSQSCNGSI